MKPFIFLALSAALAYGATSGQHGSLRAGAARVEVTTPVNPNYPPSGKYAHEHLFIRAIVLDNGLTRAALIGADLSGLSEDIWSAASNQIPAEINCPIENIVMSATHSHSALAAGPITPGTARPPQQRTAPTVTALMEPYAK